MYIYKLGYYSYEESHFIELMHEKQFSQDQITELVGEAVVEIIKQYKNDPEDTHPYLHSLQDFMSDYQDKGRSIGTYLVRVHGFKPVEYEANWSCFGWASIFDKTDWGGDKDRDEKLEKITEMVNKAGFTRKDGSHLGKMDKLEAEHRNG